MIMAKDRFQWVVEVDGVIAAIRDQLASAEMGRPLVAPIPWHEDNRSRGQETRAAVARRLIKLVVVPLWGAREFSESQRAEISDLTGALDRLPFDEQYRLLRQCRVLRNRHIKSLPEVSDAIFFRDLGRSLTEFPEWALGAVRELSGYRKIFAAIPGAKEILLERLSGLKSITEQTLVILELARVGLGLAQSEQGRLGKLNLELLAERCRYRPPGLKPPAKAALRRLADWREGHDVLRDSIDRVTRALKGEKREAVDAACDGLRLVFLRINHVDAARFRSLLCEAHAADSGRLRHFISALIEELGEASAVGSTLEVTKVKIATGAKFLAAGDCAAFLSLNALADELLKNSLLSEALLASFRKGHRGEVESFLCGLIERWREVAGSVGFKMDRLLAMAHSELTAFPNGEIHDLKAVLAVDPNATEGSVKGRRQRLNLFRRKRRVKWTSERRAKTISARNAGRVRGSKQGK